MSARAILSLPEMRLRRARQMLEGLPPAWGFALVVTRDRLGELLSGAELTTNLADPEAVAMLHSVARRVRP